MSLPYPEPGMRLIKQEEIDGFNTKLIEFREELISAVDNLDTHFTALKSAARERLGSLFNLDDYPATLRGMFSVEWDFPSVEPPEYLLRLNPDLYQQEQSRMSARFDEAVKLAEEAFVAEFGKLVSHLVERLTQDGAEGEKKVFRDTAITNLTDFFERFKSLNVRSNADLERLVETAQRTLSRVDPHVVRSNDSLRQQAARNSRPSSRCWTACSSTNPAGGFCGHTCQHRRHPHRRPGRRDGDRDRHHGRRAVHLWRRDRSHHSR